MITKPPPAGLTVLVTGATAGLGRHAASALHRRGHRVIATGRDAAALASLRDEGLLATALDVTDPGSIEAAAAFALAANEGAPPDVVINNAGVGVYGPLELLDDDALRMQLDVNVLGPLRVARAFLPAMRRRGRGRIVNVSSGAGRFALPYMGAYCASKFALEAASDAMRVELRPFGVEVVLIEPGVTASAFLARARPGVEALLGRSDGYDPHLRAFLAWLERHEAGAVDPDVVTREVIRAVEAHTPKTRYVPGRGRRVQLAVLPQLPDRLRDVLLARRLGLRG